MRYRPGSIQLSSSHDIPLLVQVLHSEFVTHSQLFEFLRLNHYEQDPKSFNWRVRRLVYARPPLLIAKTPASGQGDVVYSISKTAATLLQGMGECCLIGVRRPRIHDGETHTAHAIGLNDIHICALRSGLLRRWTYATEIRSQNELTSIGFVKDYDAIVALRCDGFEYCFALEYERSPKTIRQYHDIANSIANETEVSWVLYLLSNSHLLRFVSRFFSKSGIVLFGLVSEWHARLLDMNVFEPGSYISLPLWQVMNPEAKPAVGTTQQTKLEF